MATGLQYNDDDRFTMDNISILTGISLEQIREVFEFLLLLQLTQFLDGHPINVPYLGSLKVEFEKDEMIRGHKRAILRTEFKDSELLKRIIGEIEDGENTTIMSILKNFIDNQLLYIINEENAHGSGASQNTRRKRREFAVSKSFPGAGTDPDSDLN
jgi:hypothetical protein